MRPDTSITGASWKAREKVAVSMVADGDEHLEVRPLGRSCFR
jgi:hypothetical protein